MEKNAEENGSSRLVFIDNLRILLTFLVVMHHTMIAYGASGSWYFVDPSAGESMALTIVASLDQSFFMGLFFLVSAYFTDVSYNRHGAKNYLRKRLLRFGIPLLVYIVLVQPMMVYLLEIKPEGVYNFLQFYGQLFSSWTSIYYYFSGTGPLWFIFLLLIFSICYVIYRQIIKKKPVKKIEKKAPSNLFLVIIGLIMAILNFLMRIPFHGLDGESILNIQLAFVMQYIIMWVLGVVAYKRDWFRKITKKQATIWAVIIASSMIYYVIIGYIAGGFEGDISTLLGGFHWESLAYTIWESFFCLGVCICLIFLFREKLNSQRKVAKLMAENAYTIYLTHAPILVSFLVLFSLISLHPMLKFPIVLILTLSSGFLISHFILRRIPGAKKVLG